MYIYNKCEVFWPSGDQNFPKFATEIQRSVQFHVGVDFLGFPVYGSPSYVTEFVSQRVDKILDSQDRLTGLEDPQVELHLLRSCLSLCKLNHIIRTVPGFKINDVLMQFDSGLHHSLEALSSSSVSDLAWKQATFPVRLGGLGLHDASRSSSAAFVGSCNSSRPLSLRLFNDPVFMLVHKENDWTRHSSFFPGEVQCQQHLASFLPPTGSVSSSVSSTQHFFQKALDDALRSSIKVSLVSLREQARFSAVAYPHAGTWLKAIPNSSLGLAMSPREFVTSLRLRLGIPVSSTLTLSSLCVRS